MVTNLPPRSPRPAPPDEQIEALDAAKGAGQAGRRRLRALLDSADANIRGLAADALGEAGGPPEAEALLGHLADDNPAVRRAVVEALGRLRLASAAEPLAALLAHERDALVRVCAAEALGELPDAGAETVRVLLHLLRTDPTPLVRAYAAESLGRLGVAEALAAIQDRLATERNTRARASMLEALSRLGDERAVRRLLRMLVRVKDWTTRTAIMNMLDYLETPQTKPLIDAAFAELVKREPTVVEDRRRWQADVARRLRGVPGGDASPSE